MVWGEFNNPHRGGIVTVYNQGLPDIPADTSSGEVAEAEHVGTVDVDAQPERMDEAIDATHAAEANSDDAIRENDARNGFDEDDANGVPSYKLADDSIWD